MKYLSSKPFTGGANSKAFVDRWDEAFGRKEAAPAPGPVACDGVEDVSAGKDRTSPTALDRDVIMIGLVRGVTCPTISTSWPSLASPADTRIAASSDPPMPVLSDSGPQVSQAGPVQITILMA